LYRISFAKESQGNYYDYNLTLQPAVDPVCTPHGYLFSKEAILQNLLDQRKANKRKLAAWEARQEELQREQEEIRQIEEDAALIAFQHENHLGDTHVLAKRAQEEFKKQVKRSKEESGIVKSVVNIDQNRERIRENKVGFFSYITYRGHVSRSGTPRLLQWPRRR